MNNFDNWVAFCEHLGGANLQNFRVELASGYDGAGVTKEETVASGFAVGTTAVLQWAYFKTAATHERLIPKSIRFGCNTAGAAATIRFHILAQGKA